MRLYVLSSLVTETNVYNAFPAYLMNGYLSYEISVPISKVHIANAAHIAASILFKQLTKGHFTHDPCT